MPRLRWNESQIARCISLLIAMVNARRGVMLRQFADRNGWCPRAAYRDIKTLRAANVPIEHEHGWYRVAENWLPTYAIDVKRDELYALSVVRRLIPGLRETPLGRALDTLWAKLVTPGRQTMLPLGDETSFRCPTAAPI